MGEKQALILTTTFYLRVTAKMSSVALPSMGGFLSGVIISETHKQKIDVLMKVSEQRNNTKKLSWS